MPASNNRFMQAMQVEKIQGNFTRTIHHIVEDVKTISGVHGERNIVTRRIVKEQETFHDAYMLYFPQGHSMMVAADDEPQLVRLGVLADPRLVDMESGEEVPRGFNMTPKDIVENVNTRHASRNTTTLGGLTQLLGEASNG